MADDNEHLNEISQRGFVGRLRGYGKLTGPGWLQSAVTLGGGSLAGALYLGVIAGYSLMWLQPLAMLCGVIMLMALAHVTLDKGEYPFETVRRTVSPALAWGWLGSTVIANIVFCTAQSALGAATAQQNLGLNGANPFVITSTLALIAFASAVMYALGSKAMKAFEMILKLLVAMVVISFAVVAGFLLFSGRIDLGALVLGYLPDPSTLFSPSASLDPLIEATGASAGFWSDYIADTQRGRIIAAFGSAVGINMTFLLPYTLLKRGWNRSHRQLSRYDLVIALFLPFSIATSLLVISAAAAFHASDADVLDAAGMPNAEAAPAYYSVLTARLASETELPADQALVRAMADQLPMEERRLAAAISNRDAKQLSGTLAPVMGEGLSNAIFGIGILAMALSTMMVHALMNGFAISQAFGVPGKTGPFILGAAMPPLLAVFAPLAWAGDAKTALVIPAAVIATLFLPIAYLAILLLMNNKRSLESGRPGLFTNALMIFAAGIASFASIWSLSHEGIPGMVGIGGLIILAAVGITGFSRRQRLEN